MRLAVAFLLTHFMLAAQDPAPLSWTPTSRLSEARQGACAAALGDGRILISGGIGVDGAPLASAELYQSGDETFAPAGRMLAARTRHSCTVLEDGRVFVAGGGEQAEVYDPLTDTWTGVTAQEGSQPRTGHTATLLKDGRVLIAGGAEAGLEIFDPSRNTLEFVDGAALRQPRVDFTAVTRLDGDVMFIGGRSPDGASSGPVDANEVFHLADRKVSDIAGLAGGARSGHSATLLYDGRILIAGGVNSEGVDLDTAELYDPARDAFVTIEARMQGARRDHLALLIPGNGGVLLAGGSRKDQALSDTEMFLPVEGTFVKLGDLTAPRSAMAGAAIRDGRILAAGGINENGPQAACGILVTPSIQFLKSLYRPLETLQASGANFRTNQKITFSLTLVRSNTVTAINNRLITSTITTGSAISLLIGFPAVSILASVGSDAGATIVLTAQTSSGSVQTTVPIRISTSFAINSPTGVYEGTPGTFMATLTRPSVSGAPAMTGRISLSLSFDSLSCEAALPANTVSTLFAASGSSASLTNSVNSLSSGRICASYSGDAAHDPGTRSVPFTAVSRSTTTTLASAGQLVVGTPINLNASVRGQTGTPQHFLDGALSFQMDGFDMGRPDSVASASSSPSLNGTKVFTPLVTGTFSFTSRYSGDSFFRESSSPPLSVTVSRAPTQITFDSPPSTFTCGQPVSFPVRLTFPASLGLSNTSVAFGFNPLADPRPVAAGFLSVVSPGVATGTFSFPLLPVNTASLVAVFTGDPLLLSTQSSPLSLTLQRIQPRVLIQNLASETSNPVTFKVVVAPEDRHRLTCTVAPTGSVQILDGAAPLVVLPLDSDSSVSVSIPLAAGTHNLSVQYSGDRVFLPLNFGPLAVTVR